VSTYETYDGYEDVYISPDQRMPFPVNIQKVFQQHARGRLLDVGCADGRKLAFILALCPAIENVVAIEPSAGLMEKARAIFKDHGQVELHGVAVEDIDAIGVEPNSFDTITLLEVIEHVADQDALLKRLFAYLKPGGCLICSTPNRNIYALHCRVSGERRDPTHVAELSYGELRRLMSRHTPQVTYHGFWPFMFLFRCCPWLNFLNTIPGTKRFSRTIYSIAYRVARSA